MSVLVPFPLDPQPSLPGKYIAAILRAATRSTARAFARPYKMRATEIITDQDAPDDLADRPAITPARRRDRRAGPALAAIVALLIVAAPPKPDYRYCIVAFSNRPPVCFNVPNKAGRWIDCKFLHSCAPRWGG